MNKSLLKNFATAARVRLMDDVRYRLGLMGITAKGIAAPIHQTLDMETYEYSKGQTYRLTGGDVAARRALADMVRTRGFEQVVEEVAYTWFNRLIAIRFMEVNDYLPHHTRVLSSATPGQNTPDIVTRALDIDLGLTDREKQQVLDWKLSNQTDELFRFMFLKQCQQLAGMLPGLFGGGAVGNGQRTVVSGQGAGGSGYSLHTTPYSLLLTISYINPDGIVAELLKIPESYFNINSVDEDGQPTGQVEIIGWMYQYYNSELKDQTFAQLKGSNKISKERIPAATQLFTPQWIVKYLVENSLGRLWVEKLMSDGDTRTEAQIAQSFGWRYYLPEAEQPPEVAEQLKKVRKQHWAKSSGQWSVVSDQQTLLPAHRSLTPDNCSLTPDNCSLTPDHCSLTPDNCPLTTDNCPLTTDNCSLTTDLCPPPEGLRFLDPCMGSGHILVYAFDVLMQIYLSCGYTQRDAARLIVQKNITGIDIDERAWQLSYFAVMMKARQYSRHAFQDIACVGLFHMQETTGWNDKLLDFIAGRGGAYLRDDLDKLKAAYAQAKTLGSIIRPPDINTHDIKEHYWGDIKGRHYQDLEEISLQKTAEKLFKPVLLQHIALEKQYHAVVTNPPYMGSSGMNRQLSSFVKEEYPDSKSDLFAVFIERCGEMTVTGGYTAMITQHAWMFLSSYEKLRQKMNRRNIINMAHLGARAFDEIGGEVVQTTAFVLSASHIPCYQGTYCRLIDPTTQQGKEDMFLAGDNRFVTSQDNFSKIPGSPVAYWASESIVSSFLNGKEIDSLSKTRQGMIPGNVEEFVRLWHEVAYSKIGWNHTNNMDILRFGKKWFLYNKGGAYRRWYGNLEHVLNMENDGYAIKHSGKNNNYRLREPELYFKEAVTWSKISSGDFSARYMPPGCLFDIAGCCIFELDHLLPSVLAFCNSVVADSLLAMISPTLNYEVDHIKRLPISDQIEGKREEIKLLTADCIALSRYDWDCFETSWDFKRHPLVSGQRTVVSDQWSEDSDQWSEDSGQGAEDSGQWSGGRGQGAEDSGQWSGVRGQGTAGSGQQTVPSDHCSLITDHYSHWKTQTHARFAQLKANEEELNRIFIDIYGLQDELSPEVEDKDVTVYRIIDEPDEEERKMRYVLSKKDAIVTLISYAVGCMLGRYSLDVEGLAYAGGEFSEQWSVVSGQGSVGSVQKSGIRDQYYRREVVEGYGCKALPGIGGVAEGHGPGGGSVQAGEMATQGGDVRAVRPDAAGGGIHPIQHSGGAGAELHEGVHPVSVHRPGLQGGTADANPDMRKAELPDTGTNQTGACPYRRSGEDGICTEAKTAHCPLTTDHFAVDLDGILPITDEEYFSDDIVTRFVDWVRAAYGRDTLEENLRFVADALGGSGTPRDVIRSYFLKDFYKDHVKTYKKRPIYWLFDSGKQNGFKALIYMHRYDRDTLGRVRVDYLHRLQGLYENAVSSCDNILTSSASAAEKGRATKRREKLLRQLDECRVYDQALAHLAGQRIQIDLDDGVKHNYALFQGVELARDGRRAVKVDLLAGI